MLCLLLYIYNKCVIKGNYVMTNPMYSSQPNYSGVTIQIANPAVYAGGGGMDRVNSYGVSQPQICPNNNYYPQHFRHIRLNII